MIIWYRFLLDMLPSFPNTFCENGVGIGKKGEASLMLRIERLSRKSDDHEVVCGKSR